MARRAKYDLTSTYFDFRRAKIRCSKNGEKWYIKDKLGVCYILQHIDYYKYLYAYNIYNYPELKQMLLDELKEAKYPNIHIITNEED